MLTPKWILAHILIVITAVGFSLLGFWQLSRHESRIADNNLMRERLGMAPKPLDELLAEAAGDLASIAYRRATMSGTFLPEEEVLMRSQVHLGAPGFHLVTPLRFESGNGILVNRGWVPIIYDQVPVDEALPDPGVLTVEGWIQESQSRPTFGPADPPEGHLIVANRIDIPRLQQQTSVPLLPVYLVSSGGGEGLPDPVREPAFDNNGPHLGYAIQWFGFAAVGVIGYLFLLRRRIQDGSGTKARSETISKPSNPSS